MNQIRRLLLYRGSNIEKQNMVWNMAGSLCYSLVSMVLAVLVMRIVGEEDGGIFAFGFSTFGQQMFIVAYFGIRPFQITDGKGEYSFRDYLNHRILTCAGALFLGAAYLLWSVFQGSYTWYKAAAIFLLVIYKVIDGFADVYESEFQRAGSLYLTGKSNAFRSILSVACFLAVLIGTRNLMTSCIAAAAAQIAGVVLMDFSVIGALEQVDWKGKKGAVKRLFLSTGLLFLSVFLDFYIFSAAKYAIDARLDDSASGYFNLIFMPTSVIYMVANFVIRPFLTRLTLLWNENRLEELKKVIWKIGGIILGLTVLAAGGTLVLGKWVLSILEVLLGAGYEGSLVRYHIPFLVIVTGGGFYAFANLMYYVLVIMRKQTFIFRVYLVTAVIAWFLAPALVVSGGIFGASLCYMILMLLLTAGFTAGTWKFYKDKKGEYSRG